MADLPDSWIPASAGMTEKAIPGKKTQKSYIFISDNFMQNFPGIVEAILFASGKPESLTKLGAVLGLPLPALSRVIQALKNSLKERGLTLIEKGETVQLATAPEYAYYLEKFWKKDLREDLTQIALETLAIIAYRGPISRYDLEMIRGVNSVFVLRNLLRRELIQRKTEGNRVFYEVSPAFLRHLGLNQIEELPRYQEFKNQEILPSLS